MLAWLYVCAYCESYEDGAVPAWGEIFFYYTYCSADNATYFDNK